MYQYDDCNRFSLDDDVFSALWFTEQVALRWNVLHMAGKSCCGDCQADDNMASSNWNV